jgi:uncharacterized radical SAM protein YgiQ
VDAAEVRARGWEEVDVVFVTGDAYVDHPSFAMAVLGRVLEAHGYRVAILAQPDWREVAPFRALGKPRLAFCVSAGNLDSMLNHYTAHKRPRSDDAFSPGARAGRRPDRATLVYAQRCREAFPGVPVVVGGIEASMRRLAHYDYWSDTVRRSLLLDCKADLLVYGMGESPLLEILARLTAGEPVTSLHGVRGTVHVGGGDDALEVPSYEEVRDDKQAFARCQHIFQREQNPWSGRALRQRHGDRAVVQEPPQPPLATEDLDWVWALPFNKAPHPAYGVQPIPAHQMVQSSICVMRGCFGGCAFCALTEHQGKAIQSRSARSVVQEIADLARLPDYTGVVSDLGGPTANMYRMGCTSPEAERVCRRPSCVHPSVCPRLGTDVAHLLDLMKRAREAPGVKKVLVGSGVRMDLALLSDRYIRELCTHHVGGHLKVAPEHADPTTLAAMKKPGFDTFQRFQGRFAHYSAEAGKEQYLVPYFVSSHPGCDLQGAVRLAETLHREGIRPEQVQDFIPTPMTAATCMFHTGIDPVTMKPVHVERDAHRKRQQKALVQHWRPENQELVKEALHEAGRGDLVGFHQGALVEPHVRHGWRPPVKQGKLHGRPPKARHAQNARVGGPRPKGNVDRVSRPKGRSR